MLTAVILNSFSEMYDNSEDQCSDSLLGRLQNRLQDNDDSMLKSLKEDMPHNDVGKVDKFIPVIKDVIILSRNAFTMLPYDKSYLPLDEVADLLVLNDLDFKGLKRFQSVNW